MKFQDLKIRDIGRMVAITVGLVLLVVGGLSVRAKLDPLMHGRYLAMLTGLAIVCPMVLAMSVYYLFSTPEQNARFIKWAERHRGRRPPPDFDWTLLDASDPNYKVPTFRYLIAKWARAKRR
jgi:hypothetical protein